MEATISTNSAIVDLQKISGEPVAEWVLRARTHLGLNQTDFAKLCGLPPNYISRIEAGLNKNPGPKIMDAIADGIKKGLHGADAMLVTDVITIPQSLLEFLLSDDALDLRPTVNEINRLLSWKLTGVRQTNPYAWRQLLLALRSIQDGSNKT